MEFAHKLLNSQETAFILIPRPSGDILLVLKAETVVFPAGQLMEPVSNRQDELEIFLEVLIFSVGELAMVLQVPGGSQFEKRFRAWLKRKPCNLCAILRRLPKQALR